MDKHIKEYLSSIGRKGGKVKKPKGFAINREALQKALDTRAKNKEGKQ